MSTDFEASILEIIEKNALAGGKFLAWVSGGADSVCLCRLLHGLLHKGAISGLELAHVDHGLRADSALDANFVGALAADLKIPFHLVSLSKSDFGVGGNIQARARELRREKLEALRVARGLDASCLAHHADDSAETVLFRLLRGAGPRGVAGMKVWSPPLFRPLLDRTKAELLLLASERGWSYREDPTNSTPKYSRNRVRNELLPLAREIAPGADGAILRFAALAADDEDLLTVLALREYGKLSNEEPEGVRFSAEEIAALHPALRRRVLLAAAERVGGGAFPSLLHGHILEIENLLLPGTAQRKAPVPGTPHFYRSYGDLWVVGPERVKSLANPSNVIPVLGPSGSAPEGAAAVPLPHGRPNGKIVLRPRMPGDRLSGEKVKDILMEEKIPRWRRSCAVVAEDGEGLLAVFAEGVAFGTVREGEVFLWLAPSGPETVLK